MQLFPRQPRQLLRGNHTYPLRAPGLIHPCVHWLRSTPRAVRVRTPLPGFEWAHHPCILNKSPINDFDLFCSCDVHPRSMSVATTIGLSPFTRVHGYSAKTEVRMWAFPRPYSNRVVPPWIFTPKPELPPKTSRIKHELLGLLLAQSNFNGTDLGKLDGSPLQHKQLPCFRTA